MANLSARVRITGLQGNIGPVGGYAQIGSGPKPVRLWSGRAWGWDENGHQACQAELDWKSSGGFGFSFHFLSNRLTYNCENKDCAFANNDRVTLSVGTILFVTVSKVDFYFCDHRSSGWKIGLGLGLGIQGSEWRIQNVRPW